MRIEVPPIPDLLRSELGFLLGATEAARWLEGAVAHGTALLDAWELEPHEVLTGGSQSLCIKCDDRAGAPVVLKIPASVPGGAAEIAALRAWGGRGAAHVLRVDPETSAMLMNYLGRVGEGHYELGDVVELAGRLHRADPAAYPFPGLEENLARRLWWARERFSEPGYAAHRTDLAAAEKLLAGLADGGAAVLLHGDLQAKNLILDGNELSVVDPLPVRGPAVFDLAFWVAKTVHEDPALTCLDRVADLRPDLDPELLLRWSWALAVVEYRPYSPTAEHRQAFIDGARDLVG